MFVVSVRAVLRGGDVHQLDAQPGTNLMEALCDSGVDEMPALCGGSLSSATCHIVVDDDWIDRVGRANADENHLLDSSDHCTVPSRLSCQIRLDDALDALRVTIAPED
ncbi:2Fe-2S iron-sulfur cluster-binding protein [Sphingobium lactosutens]|nr:2Fe-2S iron-sulfur cluster-binding protein [Sphingobium sp. UBA5915]MBS48889.1 ferredoxin [Sphingobium sp.]MCC4256212.1 2Fe-2S iron-sulfur cluster-binding protein [Sphingobium lactosutens]HCW62087.1 ferredoxin [Sphingobium sp.]|tara:strand:+ start:9927 stop:10250 length:324 start_codon:yes stop_codon:yes gene_type:complete